MIIPSSSMGVFASSKPKIVISGGGGSDATPDAVNWANVGFVAEGNFWAYSTRQITGISTPITLSVSWTGDMTIFYRLVGNSAPSIGSGDVSTIATPTSLSMTSTANGATFEVSNNQYVTFTGEQGSILIGRTVFVRNVSDSNNTLDNFNVDYCCL